MGYVVGTHSHEVDYAKWCPSCKHYKEKESCYECDYCLIQPWNIDSRKPLYWAEGEMTNEAGES